MFVSLFGSRTYSAGIRHPHMRSLSRSSAVIRQLSRHTKANRGYASSSTSASCSSVSLSEPCFAPIPNRGFISVTGPEPNLSNFLNGILSTQVLPATTAGEHTGFYSTFLSRHVRNMPTSPIEMRSLTICMYLGTSTLRCILPSPS